MRFFEKLICVGFIGAVGTVADVQAQVQAINGPTLGVTRDSSGSTLRPIWGVAGASLLGDPLPLDLGVHSVVISPLQNYALAVANSDDQPVVIDLTTAAQHVIPISAAHPLPDLISISPSGLAAATFDAASGTIQVIQGLPGAPGITREFNASSVSGQATALSISDSGTVAILKVVTADGTSLWTLNSTGSVSRLPIDQPAAAVFLPNREDAIVSDDGTRSAMIILDAGGTATPVPLVSNIDGMKGFSSAAASDDGARVFLADSSSGNVAVVDVKTRTSLVVSCGCQPAGLYRLNGSSIFRLNDASRDPIMVLDASGSQPRIVVVPPSANADGTQDTTDKHKERKTL